MLLNIILHAVNESQEQDYISNNCYVECAYYPSSHKLVVNSDADQAATITTQNGPKKVTLTPYDTQMIEL